MNKRNTLALIRMAQGHEMWLERAIPDTDDIDFAALALKLDCPLWSNDKELKQQSVVKIFATSDLISFLSETRP